MRANGSTLRWQHRGLRCTVAGRWSSLRGGGIRHLWPPALSTVSCSLRCQRDQIHQQQPVCHMTSVQLSPPVCVCVYVSVYGFLFPCSPSGELSWMSLHGRSVSVFHAAKLRLRAGICRAGGSSRNRIAWTHAAAPPPPPPPCLRGWNRRWPISWEVWWLEAPTGTIPAARICRWGSRTADRSSWGCLRTRSSARRTTSRDRSSSWRRPSGCRGPPATQSE